MTRRASVAAALVLALALAGRAGAQFSGDPLTGGTPDAGAALGMKPVEAVYFDAKGNVTDDASQAAKYSITDNVRGTSTLPKPMDKMTAEERKQVGLPDPKAEAEKTAEKPAEKPTPKAGKDAAKPEAKGEGKEKAAGSAAGRKEGGDKGDASGLDFKEVTPSLVDAAQESFGTRDGQALATGPAEAGPSGEGANHLFVAPAVAAQMDAMAGPAAASPRGYRSLAALVALRNKLVAQLAQAVSGGAPLAAYGQAYDGNADLAPAVEQAREADVRFGVAQEDAQH